MSLGPVTGNRYAGANKAQPKSNLQERLTEQVQRRTSQGTFKTGADGRMEFIPKMTPTHNQQVLQNMCGIKSEPTPEMLAKRAAEEARSEQPAGLSAAEAGVLTPSEAAKEFGYDPMTEPLALGDYVEVVLRQIGFPNTGKRGHVISIGAGTKLRYDDGTVEPNEGYARRDSLKLLRKAAPAFNPLTEPLQVCDYVEVVCDGANELGKRGHIYAIKDGARYVVYDDGTCDSGGGWVLRDSLKLIKKADA